MLPSVSLAQHIGLAVLAVAVLVRVAGLGRRTRGSRIPHPEPAVPKNLPSIPAQRGRASHPLESVELTEAEKQAFARLIRSIPQR
ncbi:hypothetical protein [Streptomyces sp. NPDC002990]